MLSPRPTLVSWQQAVFVDATVLPEHRSLFLHDAAASASAFASTYAVTWGLDERSADQVAAALRDGRLPVGLSDAPWAAIVLLPDGTVAASSSPAHAPGLCWSWDTSQGKSKLVIAPFIGAVVRARGARGSLDDSFAAHQFGVGRTRSNHSTPYAGVSRLPSGEVALWARLNTQPGLKPWCGPEVWYEPGMEATDLPQRYLYTFDAAVDALTPATGPLCATMSGGLDSTFLVASLARHASADRPVHAFVHSPNPEARLTPRGNWDPDDYPVALAMERLHPHLVIHRVINSDRRQPLDVAMESAQRLWIPAANPLNQPWLRAINDAAAELGAKQVFVAGRGNPAFSDSHSYAAGYHASRGEWRDVAAIARPYSQHEVVRGMQTGPALLSRQLAGAAKRVRSQRPTPHPWHALVPAARPQTWDTVGTPRWRYLRWLAAQGQRGLTIAPAGWRVPYVDPFATESMLDLAAAIKPADWARAGFPRGFARLVARGRLPDEIRLRTRRGGQAWDAWFTIHDRKSEHLAAAEALIDDPTLGAWVDADVLLAEVRSWPWGKPHAADPTRLPAVMDLLSFGAAWRTLRSML